MHEVSTLSDHDRLAVKTAVMEAISQIVLLEKNIGKSTAFTQKEKARYRKYLAELRKYERSEQ